MGLFIKILLSLLYPLLLFVLLAGATTQYAKSVNPSSVTLGARLTMAFLSVLLPIFFYSVWNKSRSLKIKLFQFVTGSVTAVVLRIITSAAGDYIFLQSFNLVLVEVFRTISTILIVIFSIYLARVIERRLTRPVL